jgi:hypothetical protein
VVTNVVAVYVKYAAAQPEAKNLAAGRPLEEEMTQEKEMEGVRIKEEPGEEVRIKDEPMWSIDSVMVTPWSCRVHYWYYSSSIQH